LCGFGKNPTSQREVGFFGFPKAWVFLLCQDSALADLNYDSGELASIAGFAGRWTTLENGNSSAVCSNVVR
jgi:hypothetical protein